MLVLLCIKSNFYGFIAKDFSALENGFEWTEPDSKLKKTHRLLTKSLCLLLILCFSCPPLNKAALH